MIATPRMKRALFHRHVRAWVRRMIASTPRRTKPEAWRPTIATPLASHAHHTRRLPVSSQRRTHATLSAHISQKSMYILASREWAKRKAEQAASAADNTAALRLTI